MITQSELKELVTYCPETGVFTWKDRSEKHFNSLAICKSWNSRFAGTSCGTNSNGYTLVVIKHKTHQAHRLAWLYVHGEFPPNQIDHINHDRSDNRVKNLRLCTNSENAKNKSKGKNNLSGVTGVYWQKEAKAWHAHITVNGERMYLGCHPDIKSAAIARKNAEELHGFHSNHGR